MEDTLMNTIFHGGMVVTPEMKEIISQPGFLSIAKGGQRLRDLYRAQSTAYNIKYVSEFGMLCYVGFYEQIKQMVESGHAPDLVGTETTYHYGYATILISGAQRIKRSGVPNAPLLKHVETLSYLFSQGMPADVPDIVGCTALHHVLTTPSVAPELDMEFARILIEEGRANVNCQNRYGIVPIFTAMQRHHVEGIQLLLEHGASMDIKEADGLTPEDFYVGCGPEVTAVVRKCLAKRDGKGQRPREEKKCEACGSKGDNEMENLKNCSRCQVARYCSKRCQKKHWSTHKASCEPFSASTTITIKPYYEGIGGLLHASALKRQVFGEELCPLPSSNPQNLFRPGSAFPANTSVTSPKSIIIKVQVPYAHLGPPPDSKGGILVYTKKRDLTCYVIRTDDKVAYDRLLRVVKEKGVKGAKAYFAAELRGKDKLVIKVSEVLAEQPW